MIIINASPDNIIQLGYEGEDRVTVLRVRYGEDWLENGDGVFSVRFLRNGENQAYYSQMVLDDRKNHCLLITLTAVELSKKGTNEMQVVYSGKDFIKKSPVYRYYVSRSVDEAVDPPTEDVYTQIIESLSDLQTDVRQIDSDVADLSELTTAKIGDLTELTTMAKTDLVSAINEVNEHGGGSVAVDSALSDTSENPVQNKTITGAIREVSSYARDLSGVIDGLGEDVEGLETALRTKADTQTVSALADEVNGLDGDVQGLQTTKADKSYVDDAISHVSIDVDSDFSDTSENPIQNKVITTAFTNALQMLQNLGYTVEDNGIQIASLKQGKADKTMATASSDGLMSAQDKTRLDAVYTDYTSALTALGGES